MLFLAVPSLFPIDIYHISSETTKNKVILKGSFYTKMGFDADFDTKKHPP